LPNTTATATSACWRERPLTGNFRADPERPELGRELSSPAVDLTSRSIFSRAAVQKINLRSDHGEFRQSRERPVTLRSPNHFVRAQQQRLRNREAKRFGSFEIDHELEFDGLLDGQIAGVSAS